MKKFVWAIFVIFCFGVAAHAEISCKNNVLGKTICTDSDTGIKIRERTSASGRTKYTTSNGKTIKSKTSATGTTTYTNSDGQRTKCRKNAMGHTICTNGTGAKTTCRTNALGKTVCK